MNKLELAAAAAAAMLCLTACGGGESAPATGSASPAASSSIVSSGTITGFGSVFVNGVRYDTSAATFTINGKPGTQSELRVGHVITLRGHRNGTSSVADAIVFDDLVKGPVTSVNAAGSQLVVLGQTVAIDGDTSFDDNIAGAALTGLATGDLVEVSGLRRADGSIQATRIEKKPAGTSFEVTGRASAVDTTNRKLNVHGLVVNYATATLSNFASGQPQNGDLVEAKGTSVNTTGELVATSLERKSPDDQSSGIDNHIEGLVTRFVSATDFDVANRKVTTSSGTTFENGTAANLALNVKVEVEGRVDATGTLVATKVQFKRQASARIEARVDAVDRTANKVTLLGIEATVNAMTRLEDKGDVRATNFSLADVVVGDYLEIRGAELPAGSNKVVASRLERRRVESDVGMRGVVDTVTRPALTILGVNIQTTSGTRFESLAGASISADEFFAAANGKIVAVKGTFASGILTAREIEFEND